MRGRPATGAAAHAPPRQPPLAGTNTALLPPSHFPIGLAGGPGGSPGSAPASSADGAATFSPAFYRDTENEITPADIDMPAAAIGTPAGPAAPFARGGGFEPRVESFRKQLILDALDQAKGNQAQAARSLGLSYHQYRYFLRKYSAARP